MRGGVAISVTATPAAAPRRSREVLRISVREPSSRLRPTVGLDRRPSSISAIGSPVPQVARLKGYPLHPIEQDMISAVGIKDQALTRIVSMMLIELPFCA